MGDKSAIEWCDATWNPVVGCEKVSAGCANCYAVGAAARIARMQPGSTSYRGLTVIHGNGRTDWSGEVRCLPERLLQPLNWRRPRKIFVNSMSDLFHPAVPEEFIWQVFAVMGSAARAGHTFQVLTKRPRRMASLLNRDDALEQICGAAESIAGENGWCHMGEDEFFMPFSGVWLGVSVEDQATADERIPELLRVPAAVRFLSMEPLLGPVNLAQYWRETPAAGCVKSNFGEGETWDTWLDGGIHWVIVGGESGKNARPMHPDWARSLRDQCVGAGVPFFFKQHGEYVSIYDWPAEVEKAFVAAAHPNGRTQPAWIIGCSEKTGWLPMVRVGKKAAGHILDGYTWDGFPTLKTREMGGTR